MFSSIYFHTILSTNWWERIYFNLFLCILILMMNQIKIYLPSYLTDSRQKWQSLIEINVHTTTKADSILRIKSESYPDCHRVDKISINFNMCQLISTTLYESLGPPWLRFCSWLPTLTSDYISLILIPQKLKKFQNKLHASTSYCCKYFDWIMKYRKHQCLPLFWDFKKMKIT